MTLERSPINDFVTDLKERFGSSAIKTEVRSEKRVFIDIPHQDIQIWVEHIFKKKGLRFNIISAVDTFNGFEVLYHFSHDKDDFVLTLRTILTDRSKPSIDTITKITKGAWWIEREIHELFGIYFNGNDDLRRLLLPDDWPDGVYPLRKDFTPNKRDSRKI